MMTSTRKTLIVAAALVLGITLNVGLVVAQSSGDYYTENSTSDIENESWLSGVTDGDLPDILNLLTRIGPYIIGSGFSAQGGVGSARALITGLLVGGVMAGAGFRAGIGSVAGAVVAVVATWAFVSVDLGPTWAYPVVLFIVGVIASSVVLRAVR